MNRSITTLTAVLLIIFSTTVSCECTKGKRASSFEVEYQWTFINFTWENENTYNDAVTTKRYIPENNAMAGIKFYKDTFYIAMPRICEGTPVTLGYISTSDTTPKSESLISPFPDWNTNDLTNHTCDKLENVQSMEIDADGIMWVLDGFRKPTSKCPPKLVLYDLNNEAKVVQSFTFPEEISLSKGGFLNDLVVDDSDGGFAYITEHGSVDPGIVVYSRAQNHAWKIRDASMFAEIDATNFVVDEVVFNKLAPVDGIALSPRNPSGPRQLYYCALTGVNLYSISTEILKDETACSGGEWRVNVTHIGAKSAQSDGMVVDNTGVLYYGLLPLYGVGSWNSSGSFEDAGVVYANNGTMIWTDSFSFDDKGYLYLLANNIHKYFLTQCAFDSTEPYVKFRILKHFTGTQSYLH
ncbi:protein yellow-like [Zophobas morio]|uniref:protein yellow-like n=1 Tax=Zophobas morio TaxID=2755281 RepID=UPI003082ABCC